jgi:hypothetical protein
MVRLGGRESYVPTGRGEVKTGTLAAILKQLDLRRDQL